MSSKPHSMNLINSDQTKTISKTSKIDDKLRSRCKLKDSPFSGTDYIYIRSWDHKKYKYQQQSVSGNQWPHRIVAFPYNLILLSCLSAYMIILAVILFQFSHQSRQLKIPYTENTTSEPIFLSAKSWKFNKPFYFYVQVNSFADTSRAYMKSRPPEIFGLYSCGNMTTVHTFRRVRSFQKTLPEIPKLQHLPDDQHIYPCGRSSFAMFNDKFRIKYQGEEISLTLVGVDHDWKYIIFNPKARPEGLKPEDDWINLASPQYRFWMSTQLYKAKKILYGWSSEGLPGEGSYDFEFYHNVWPSSAFKARKAIVIEQLSFIGSEQICLAYIYLILGLGMMVVTITLLVLHRFKFHIRTKSLYLLSDYSVIF